MVITPSPSAGTPALISPSTTEKPVHASPMPNRSPPVQWRTAKRISPSAAQAAANSTGSGAVTVIVKFIKVGSGNSHSFVN